MAVPATRARFDWTPEREEDLKRRWDAGESGGFIAREYGVTRNVVIGKVHRLKLAKRLSTKNGYRSLKRAPAPKPPKAVRIKASPLTGLVSHGPSIVGDTRILRSKAWEPLPGSKPVLLMERTGCKWPVNWPGEQIARFCNEPVEGEGPYCEAHHARSVPRQ